MQEEYAVRAYKRWRDNISSHITTTSGIYKVSGVFSQLLSLGKRQKSFKSRELRGDGFLRHRERRASLIGMRVSLTPKLFLHAGASIKGWRNATLCIPGGRSLKVTLDKEEVFGLL
jgi:hypothetical protein